MASAEHPRREGAVPLPLAHRRVADWHLGLVHDRRIDLRVVPSRTPAGDGCRGANEGVRCLRAQPWDAPVAREICTARQLRLEPQQADVVAREVKLRVANALRHSDDLGAGVRDVTEDVVGVQERAVLRRCRALL